MKHDEIGFDGSVVDLLTRYNSKQRTVSSPPRHGVTLDVRCGETLHVPGCAEERHDTLQLPSIFSPRAILLAKVPGALEVEARQQSYRQGFVFDSCLIRKQRVEQLVP